MDHLSFCASVIVGHTDFKPTDIDPGLPDLVHNNINSITILNQAILKMWIMGNQCLWII